MILTIDEVGGADPEMRKALRDAALPLDDLAQPGRGFFRFSEGGRVVGFVGYEDVGAAGALLRSLVVLPSERGRGRGTRMAEWMLRHLRGRGVEDVWMLTDTAMDLGQGLGFVRTSRDRAPDGVRATRQFASLCSASAVLMHKSLR